MTLIADEAPRSRFSREAGTWPKARAPSAKTTTRKVAVLLHRNVT